MVRLHGVPEREKKQIVNEIQLLHALSHPHILAFRGTEKFVYHKMPRGARMGGCTNKAVKIVASEQFDLRKPGVGTKSGPTG